MKGWLAALRIARREARRAKGRSALVVALVGVPVLALTFAAVSYDIFTLSTPERLERQIGTAEAELQWVADGPIGQVDGAIVQIDGGMMIVEDGAGVAAPPTPTAAEVEAVLPAGSRAIPRWQGSVQAPTATGLGWLEWLAVDLADPLAHGTGHAVAGRLPGPGELALTAAAADRMAVEIGDRVELPDAGTYQVVGRVEFPGANGDWPVPGLHDEILLFHPDRAPPDGFVRWLVGTPEPVDWEQVLALNQHGISVYSRAVALDPPPGVRDDPHIGQVLESSTWGGTSPVIPALGVGALVAGLAVLEIVLLAGPAFAVGARRRQRELALVAAGGGTPAHLRRIVLADGVVLGAVAALAGIGLGILVAFAARPLTETVVVGARAGGYRVFPLALAGIAVFAVGTAVLAALVPAFTAARQQVVAALAGRRGAAGSRRRWLILGLVMTGLGTAVAAAGAWQVSEELILAGLILGQLGLALCTPALIGLISRVGARVPLALRMALRDTARNRAATAPAMAAVMAAVAGGVGAGVIVVGLSGQGGSSLPYVPGTALVYDGHGVVAGGSPAEIEAAARATLPVADFHRAWTIGCPEPEPAGSDDEPACEVPLALLPEEQVCPYWDRAWDLSPAEQRQARGDPRCAGENPAPFTWVTIDDGSALPVLTGGGAPDLAAAVQVLRDGGAVVTDARYLRDGRITLGYVDDGDPTPRETVATVPGYLLTTGQPWDGAIVSPATVRAAGLIPEQNGDLIVATSRLPTTAEQDAFQAALAGLETTGFVVSPPADAQVDPRLLLLTAAAIVIALGAAGIATGLAAADRRPDLSTLAAVGASPRLRRRLSLSQAGVIAGLGTALGLLAGLGASTAVLVALNQRYTATWPAPEPLPIQVPWTQLSMLLAVPVVAMLAAGLLTRSRLPIERRLT